MLFTVFCKELLSYVLTFRLALSFCLVVALSALAAFVGSESYSVRFDLYEERARVASAKLEEIHVYSQIAPDIIVPPSPLSIFGRGVSEMSGYVMSISLNYIDPIAWPIGSESNLLMQTLIQIDLVTVVSIVMSFLAIMIGFDAISGERESGVLKQILANPIARSTFILSKLLAGGAILGSAVIVVVFVSLLILMQNPDVDLAGRDWAYLALWAFVSCLFLVQVFCISLMVSSFAENSDTSLAICLSLWLIGGIGYINGLPFMARYMVEETPWQTFLDQRDQVWQDYNAEVGLWEERNPGPGDLYLAGIENDGVLRFAHPDGYSWLQKKNGFSVEKKLHAVEKIYKLQWENWRPLAEQAFAVDRLSIFSPLANYQTTSYQLLQTTLDDRIHLAKSGHRYRETIIQYLRANGAWGSRRWFTDDPIGHEPLIPFPDRLIKEPPEFRAQFIREKRERAQAELQAIQVRASRKLDTTDMPKFPGYAGRGFMEVLANLAPGLIVILLSLILSIVITVNRFLKYDPR